jgi:hypothetical protein
MTRTALRFAQAALLLTIAAGMTGCPSTPLLVVSGTAFDFGESLEQDSLFISNGGGGTLVWTAVGVDAIPWLSVSPTGGSVDATAKGLDAVTLTVDRSGLIPGTNNAEFTITSNGGTQIVRIAVTTPIPPTPVLSVTPIVLDFGNAELSKPLTIGNAGGADLTWTMTKTIAEAFDWLDASAFSGTRAPGESTPITVTVDRSGLTPGNYSGTLSIDSNDGMQDVTVLLSVPGDAPLLFVDPLSRDFGDSVTELQILVRNDGTGQLNWNAAESEAWLALSPTAGNLAPGASTTIVATVDRTGLAAGDYDTSISITSNGGSAVVSVDMTVAETVLVVSPLTLNFGQFATTKLFTVANGGVGTVNWSVDSIDTNGTGAWLTVDPASGSVTLTPEAVIARVDRTALAPGNYTATINITSNAGSATINVFMSVAVVPVLTVDSGAVNSDGFPIVALGDEDNQRTFDISNTGTGTLDWEIDPNDFPIWLTMAPVAGARLPGETDTVTVTVSRLDLVAGGYTALIPISSNGGNDFIEITMQVPLRPVILVQPQTINLGTNRDADIFGVANIGDLGTVLNFRVESNRDWLFFGPPTGSSVAIPPPDLDLQIINISVDRSNLNSTGDTGTLTIYAIDSEGEIDEDVAPRTVTVSVEAAALSFETPAARLRIPSLVRWVVTQRDFQDRAIRIPDADVPSFADAFRIFDDGVILEATETNQFLVPNSHIRANLVLLLDYSGSLAQAAQQIGTTIQAVHEQAVTEFVNGVLGNVPGHYNIALMEFHDRNVAPSIVQDFTNDAATLIAAVQSISISDNGATELLPAVEAGAQALIDADFPLIPFDDADLRGLCIITDGRMTTPPGEVSETADFLKVNKIRMLSVGWGVEVNNEPMARMATDTGGHHYPVLPDANDDPILANLIARVEYRAPIDGSPVPELNRPLSIPNDLATTVVLGYVTLNEGENIPVRFDAAFDDPTDNPNQGTIQGNLEEQNLPFESVLGDTGLGQVSMNTDGHAGGTAFVYIRSDYLPRNVNKFSMTLGTDIGTPTFTVMQVPALDGGLIEGWTPNAGNPAGAVTAGTYRFDSPGGEGLQYGSFGNLLRVDIAGIVGDFRLTLTLDNTIYAGDIEPKYFTFPDTIPVTGAPFIAPAFPTPSVMPVEFDFGTATNQFTIAIENIGGSLLSQNVVLNWLVSETPAIIAAGPDEGVLVSTLELDNVFVLLDRTQEDGVYDDVIGIDYNLGSVNFSGTIPVRIQATILPPVLTVNTNTLDFGTATDILAFNITNTGQSTMTWSIDNSNIPAWVDSVAPISGSTTGEIDTVTIEIDRSVLTSGDIVNFDLVVTDGDFNTETVTLMVEEP